MIKSDYYKNGQIVKVIDNNYLRYYYKNGFIKAEGSYIKDMMEGTWKFYHDDKTLWQIGNFLNNTKHGKWIRYNRLNEIEYEETFKNGKLIKK